MELITILLNAFIQLADRINNLEKAKLQDQKVVFVEIVEPLFTELEPIAKSYILFFRKARQLIVEKKQLTENLESDIFGGRSLTREGENELQEMAQYLKQERDAMSMARIKVSETANQIKEDIKNTDVVAFADSVTTFFFNSPSNRPKVQLPQDSKATEFLERLNESLRKNYDEQDLIEYIDEVLLGMENSWGGIVRAYEKIKNYSISSPKLVNKPKNKKTKTQ